MKNMFNENQNGAAVIRRYRAKQKAVQITVSVVRYVFLIAFSYIVLYPLLFMLAHSFRDASSLMDPTVEWVPKIFSLEPVKWAWKVMLLPGSFFNSVKVELGSAILTILSTGVAAYGVACFDFKGKKVLLAMMVLMIMVPSSMVLVPNYINYNNLNLLDTLWCFYLPSFCAVGIKSGFCIFIYLQFYRGLPKELREAAWIDGANALQTYVRIVVPSSGVAVLTVSLLCIIWNWNDYYNAQMYVTSMPTMAMRLNGFFAYAMSGKDAVDAAMAAGLMFVLPMLILYLCLQKKFISSIASTGIVG